MDDLISRQALMKEFSDFVRKSNNSDFVRVPTWNDAVSLVESMPSAQPEQKHGRWAIDNGCVCCSECGEPNMEWNYCPNCGARMEE